MKKVLLYVLGAISALLAVFAAVIAVRYAQEQAFWEEYCKQPNH